MPYQPDQTDLKILRELEHNGRITNKELAEKVNLSPAPTLERVRKLEELGFIRGYYTKVNYERLGFPIHALLLVKTDPKQQENASSFLREKIGKAKPVKKITFLEGEFNAQVEAVFTGMNELHELKSKMIREAFVADIQILFVLGAEQ